MSSAALVSLSRHTLRQVKFILPGGLITFSLGTHDIYLRLLKGEGDVGGWAQTLAVSTLASGILTLSLFIYIMLIPLISGEQPNYRQWRQSGVLSNVIPILTASILIGWSLLSFLFGHYTSLGYIKGLAGASGLYALSFGLLGLLPAPRVRRH